MAYKRPVGWSDMTHDEKNTAISELLRRVNEDARKASVVAENLSQTLSQLDAMDARTIELELLLSQEKGKVSQCSDAILISDRNFQSAKREVDELRKQLRLANERLSEPRLIPEAIYQSEPRTSEFAKFMIVLMAILCVVGWLHPFN